MEDLENRIMNCLDLYFTNKLTPEFRTIGIKLNQLDKRLKSMEEKICEIDTMKDRVIPKRSSGLRKSFSLKRDPKIEKK